MLKPRGKPFEKGHEVSIENRQKLAESCRNRIVSDETRKKMSIARLGKKLSLEHRKKISEAHKGEKSYLFGKKQTKALIQKRVAGRKGYRHSIETRRRISASQKGALSHKWRGGVTSEHKRIRRSIDFKLWREAVFDRDNYTCQWCGVRGGVLHPDHIKPFALYADLRFDINNGRTLCAPCHRRTDTWGGRARSNAILNQ